MVQAENIDSGIPNFQLDNRFGRDYHSLAHLPKFILTQRRSILRPQKPSVRSPAAVAWRRARRSAPEREGRYQTDAPGSSADVRPGARQQQVDDLLPIR